MFWNDNHCVPVQSVCALLVKGATVLSNCNPTDSVKLFKGLQQSWRKCGGSIAKHSSWWTTMEVSRTSYGRKGSLSRCLKWWVFMTHLLLSRVLLIPSDKDDWMDANIKLTKIPRALNKTPKNPWTKNSPSPQPVAAILPSDWAEKHKVFWHQSEGRTAATVWNWSGKTLSPGALLAVLYFSSCHIFPPI